MHDFCMELRRKYSLLPIPAKASFWYMLCSILQRGLSFLITPFFTRIMSLEEYGTVSLYYSWMVFVTVIATLAIPTGGFSKAMSKFADERNEYTSSVLSLSSVFSIICCVVYFVLRSLFGDFLGLDSKVMLLMFVDILFTTPLILWTIQNRFEFKYRWVVLITIVVSILTVILNVVTVLHFVQNKIMARIGSTVLVHVFIYGGIMLYIYAKGKCFYKKRYWKYALLYNLPLIPHYLSQQVLIQSDRVMIDRICKTSDVAIYSLAYTFAVLMQIVVDAVHASFVPWSYQCMDDGKFEQVRKRTIQLVIVVGCLCLIISLIAPEVIMVLGGEKYLPATQIIPPVSMSVLLILLYSIFGNIEFYYEKTGYVMIASVVSSVINIILNFIFIPKYGFVAAGYTTLFSYFIYAGIHFVLMKYIVKLKEIEQPYRGGLMWLIALIYIILAIGISFLYELFLIRYVILIIIVICLLAYYKRGTIE